MCYTVLTDEPTEVLMDIKQSLELAVLVIAAIAIVASLFNLLTRERRPKIGYTYSGSGYSDGTGSFPGQGTDPSPFSGSHGGHHCTHSGSGSSDGGGCGGGDGGGGGGD